MELFLGADRFRLGSLHLPYEQREDSTDVWQNTLESCTQVLATFPSQNPVFLGCDLNQPLHVAVDHFPPLVQLRLLMSRFLLRPSDDVGPTWHARGLSAAIDFVLFRHPGMLGVTTSRADIRLALPSDHDMVQVSFSHYWPSAGPAQQPRNRGEQNFFSAMTFRLLVPAPFSPIDLVSPPCTPPPNQSKPRDRQFAAVSEARTQLDSDSEDSDCLTLAPDVGSLPSHPNLPGNLTGHRNLRPAESEALELLRKPQAPSKASIVRLFDLVPRQLMKRCPTGRFLVTGLEMPLMTRALNRFLRSRAPHCRYTTIAVREGCVSEPHRDSRNGPLKACVLGLTPQTPFEGIWVQDSRGPVFKLFKGRPIAGTVYGIEEHFCFESWRLLHAGHCSTSHHLEGSRRVIMVAFCTLHASTMDPVTRDGLLELGFALPTVEEIRTAVFARPVSEGEGPRQLLLEEAWRTRESNRYTL